MIQRVLLVEGSDDKHVMLALLQAHRVPEEFKIKDMGGVDPLLESLAVRLKARSEERLGVLLDADEDLEARWLSIRNLVHRHFPAALPERPGAEGTVVDLDEAFRFGAWIMPDNTLPGILEDFVRFLVPDGDALMAHTSDFVDGLPAGLCRFPATRRPKALIHSWLALQEQPGRPIGLAVTCKYLDAKAQVVQPLLDWIRALFIH